VIAPRLIESYAIYLACLKAGIIVIPSSELLRAKDIQYRLHHAEAKAIISYHPFCNEIDKIENFPTSLQHKITFGADETSWTRLEAL
ncbi:AMP-binding protein, partial [Bacillus sp. SIMBA_069]